MKQQASDGRSSRADLHDLRDAYEANFAPLFAFVYGQTQSVSKARRLAEATIRKHATQTEPSDARIAVFRAATWALAELRSRANGSRPADQSWEAAGAVIEPTHSAGPRQTLKACLRSLSGREREVLGLRFDAQLSVGEIAAVTSATEADVAVAIAGALRKLKERFEAVDGERR